MFVVDTNVLVYAADESAPEHERCRSLLQTWRLRNGAWYLTWGICCFSSGLQGVKKEIRKFLAEFRRGDCAIR